MKAAESLAVITLLLVNMLKTKQRHRLSTRTLVGFLHSKRYLGDARCGRFSVNDKLIGKMSLSMYERDGSESDLFEP